MWIRIRIQFQIQGFDDQKLKKFSAGKFFLYYLDQKVQLTYPEAFLKDAQATGKAFKPQKRTSSTSKHEYSFRFYIFEGNFCLSESGSSDSNYCGSTTLPQSSFFGSGSATRECYRCRWWRWAGPGCPKCRVFPRSRIRRSGSHQSPPPRCAFPRPPLSWGSRPCPTVRDCCQVS
jgi:hypothetical protein